ncbi:MAG: efflux RND transporter periplasmic adaptor subunit [Pseudomonadota bacterium]
MSYRALAVLAILVLVIAVPVVSRLVDASNAKLVDAEQPGLRPIRPSILASGHLAHEEEVHLSSEVIGKVTRLLVEEGDRVDAGDLVLTIDDEAFSAQVAQNLASVRLQEIDIERRRLALANLERRHARSQSLYEQELLDEDAFEAIDYELNLARVDLTASQERLVQARATLEQFQDQLDKTQVEAPISGVVTSLDIEVGETAITSTTNIPGSGLMTIADPETIITEVFVDEADIADIDLGQQAEVVAIAYPDRPLEGTVEFVANTAKVEEGRNGLSFLVKIRITDNRGIRLRPGMSCRAAIFTETEDQVLTVPLRAVITEEDLSTKAQSHFVYVDRAGSAAKIAIEIGMADDEFQEVTQGLGEDDFVVVGPSRVLRRLNEGDAITYKTDD